MTDRLDTAYPFLSDPEIKRLAAGQCYACDAKATGHAPRHPDGGPWRDRHDLKIVLPACPRHSWDPDDFENGRLQIRINGTDMILERYPLAGEAPDFFDGDEQCEGCGAVATDSLRWHAERAVFACTECATGYQIQRYERSGSYDRSYR